MEQEFFISQEELERMKNIDIRTVDREELVDIREVKIDDALSPEEKKREFVRQIKNPFVYKQGDYVVKLSFEDTDVTLAERLKEYVEHMAAARL